jgi:drug/metabolite transporter (DMT)-like permease
MVMVSVLMVLAAMILNWLINGVIPNYYQALGGAFAIAAIYFLSK